MPVTRFIKRLYTNNNLLIFVDFYSVGIPFLCNNKLTHMLKRILFSLAMVFIGATFSQAQITTSGVTGNVIDAATKEPLVGASIVATHGPSGTKYTALSTKNGEFSIHDMKVGGP